MFDVTESVCDLNSFSLISQTFQDSSSPLLQLTNVASVETASERCFHSNSGISDQGIMGNAVLQQDTVSQSRQDLRYEAWCVRDSSVSSGREVRGQRSAVGHHGSESEPDLVAAGAADFIDVADHRIASETCGDTESRQHHTDRAVSTDSWDHTNMQNTLKAAHLDLSSEEHKHKIISTRR